MFLCLCLASSLYLCFTYFFGSKYISPIFISQSLVFLCICISLSTTLYLSLPLFSLSVSPSLSPYMYLILILHLSLSFTVSPSVSPVFLCSFIPILPHPSLSLLVHSSHSNRKTDRLFESHNCLFFKQIFFRFLEQFLFQMKHILLLLFTLIGKFRLQLKLWGKISSSICTLYCKNIAKRVLKCKTF